MGTRTSRLGQLFDAVTEANGWSMREVEKRITARGDQLSKSRISQMVNADPLESIAAGPIHALAKGLAISPDRVAMAAVQSMGFRIAGEDISPAEAISRDETLSEDTRRALLAILRAGEGRRGA